MDGSSVRFENNKGNGVLSDIFGEEFNLLKLSHLLSDFRLHQSLGGGQGVPGRVVLQRNKREGTELHC